MYKSCNQALIHVEGLEYVPSETVHVACVKDWSKDILRVFS